MKLLATLLVIDRNGITRRFQHEVTREQTIGDLLGRCIQLYAHGDETDKDSLHGCTVEISEMRAAGEERIYDVLACKGY